MSIFSEKQISVEKARELQKNWVENHGRVIRENLGIADVRDFTFELEELQGFLDQVREMSRKQGINNPGIRVFLGAYPDEEKRATIFFSATTDMRESDVTMVDQQVEEVRNNYQIMPLNTVMGGFPPTDY